MNDECKRKCQIFTPKENVVQLLDWVGYKKNLYGFVDPADEEYSKHLYREDNGKIMYNTEVGKYMYTVLKFNIRKTDLMWKIMKLNELKEELKESLKNNPDAEGDRKFVEIQNELDELLEYITYSEKE